MFFTATSFWRELINWDQAFFLKINRDWSNPVFDVIFPPLRNSLTWAPLYLFLAVFILLNFRLKGVWWAVLFLCTAAMTDMIGTYVFKHSFLRLRPCNDPGMYTYVRLMVRQCGGGYSFISNHAANHFGMATFFFITFRHLFKNWALLAFAWAGLIAYAQVYVGLHYPMDVLCGALLGMMIGLTTGTLCNKRFGFANFGNQRYL